MAYSAYQPILRVDDWDEKGARPALPSVDHDFHSVDLLQPRRARTSWPALLSGCLYALVAVAALLVIWVELGRASLFPQSPVPTFATEVRSLRPLPSYEQPPHEESNQLWESKLPNGDGFFTLANAHAYGLPRGLPNHGNATTKYGVTWAHEYHCLDMMRHEFWSALNGSSALYGGLNADPPLQAPAKKTLEHITHCYDYIRQLIMCRADMTIEWATTLHPSGQEQDHIDGYGIPHTCAKFEEVFDWMEARPAKKAEGHQH